VVIRLLLLLLSLPVGATVFQMHSVDQQINEADGIIIGHYLRSKSVKLEDGQIATQMIFKMNKELGLQSELFGMDEIIVHYPGGEQGDEHVKVEGVPTFVSGEKVVIMIKSYQNRYWGMNLGFGTFKVINYGNEKMIVNTVFPNDRRVGQVTVEEFEKKIRRIKNLNLRVVLTPVYPTELEEESPTRKPANENIEGKNRSIASNSEQEENGMNKTSLSSVWLVFLLAALGGLFRLFRQNEVK
jgi:hypothetical protein